MSCREHNLSARMYNMFLPHEKCNFAKVLTVKGVVPARFPLNPAAFWSMPGENELVQLVYFKLLTKDSVVNGICRFSCDRRFR